MKTAVVTGPTRGIGHAVAMTLARNGYRIIAAGRPGPRLDGSVETLRGAGGQVEPVELDLGSLESSRDAALKVVDSGSAVDVVVNSAGVGPSARGLTSDGFEIHFGVNHLGHFNFTHHLRPALKNGARIVQVTSSLHNVDGIDFDRLRRRTRTAAGINEYSVSKLANILFVREMARRQPALNTYAVHPGFTDTDIIPWYVKPFVARRLITPDQGAETVVWCATSDQTGTETGHYYARMARAEPRTVATDDDLAHELWKHSEIWCGLAATS